MIPCPRRISLQECIVKIRSSVREEVLSGDPADLHPPCADGLSIIIRSQESVQEPIGSWRLCFLRRTHAGHRKEYGRTNGPWVAASGGSWCRVAAREIAPVFRCSL